MSGVLIDTSMWSLAFRGRKPRQVKVAKEIGCLIDGNRARIVIRQDALSGYSDFQSYEAIRDKLRHFPNEATIDVEVAAEYSNLCRST